MRIKNECVSIRIGNKEREFHNMILNNYIDLYAESFISFKDKILPYCAIKFGGSQDIDENSTTMEYDVMLEAELPSISEIFTKDTIINKYMYYKEMNESSSIQEFEGKYISGIGFGNFDDETKAFVLYAFLDVSKYNITFQESQSIAISRTDKITTDLQFYSPCSEVKFPVHLTMKGLLEIKGLDYDKVYSELWSIGTGSLYNVIEDEIPINNLDFRKTGTGIVTIKSAEDFAIYPNLTLYPNATAYPGRQKTGLKELKIEDKGEGKYPSPLVYPNLSELPKQATKKWIIYKFKLWRERWEETNKIIEDTGLFYYQSQKTDLTGNLKLEIKYERG